MRRAHQRQRVIHHALCDEIRTGNAALDDGGIQFALEQLLFDDLRVVHEYPRRRMAGFRNIALENISQNASSHRDRRADAQHIRVIRIAQALFHRVKGRQNMPRIFTQLFTGRRDIQPSAQPFEQAHLILLLYFTDCAADRGLRNVHFLCRLAHAAAVRNRQKNAQISQGHSLLLPLCVRTVAIIIA